MDIYHELIQLISAVITDEWKNVLKTKQLIAFFYLLFKQDIKVDYKISVVIF